MRWKESSNIPSKKVWGSGDITNEFYKIFKEEVTPIPFKLFQNHEQNKTPPKSL